MFPSRPMLVTFVNKFNAKGRFLVTSIPVLEPLISKSPALPSFTSPGASNVPKSPP